MISPPFQLESPILYTDISQVVVEGNGTMNQLEYTPIAGIQPPEPRISYKQELLPYSGYVNHVSFWNTIIRPFYLIASPPVLWAVLPFTTCMT